MTQSFFKVLLHQNVFIYLETDYLKRFYFSALFCTVFFCHDHEMIDQLNYYCCNDIITTIWCILWFFFFRLQNLFCHYHHLLWHDVWNHIGSHDFSSVIRSVTCRMLWNCSGRKHECLSGKNTQFSRFAKNTFFLKCQTTDILGKHA